MEKIVGWSGIEEFDAYWISSLVRGGGKPPHYFAAGPEVHRISMRWVKVVSTDIDLWLGIDPPPPKVVKGTAVKDNSSYKFFIPRSPAK